MGKRLDQRRTKLGKHFNAGARALWRQIHKGASASAIAAMVGTDSGTFSRHLYGDQKPRIEMMLAYQSALGIPLHFWAKAVDDFVPDHPKAA